MGVDTLTGREGVGPTNKGAARVSDFLFFTFSEILYSFLKNLYLFYTCVFSTGVHVGVRVLSSKWILGTKLRSSGLMTFTQRHLPNHFSEVFENDTLI